MLPGLLRKKSSKDKQQMFVHSVYFWLKPDLGKGDVAKFWQSVNALTKIPSVKHGWVGKPANTDRAIIDRSYTCALVLAFDDETGHDAYQVHPDHEDFRQGCGSFWSKIVIYDAISEA